MQFVTDRTQADVDLGNEKGCYGFADLNRVEQTVSELADILRAKGIQVDLQSVKTDWALPGIYSADTWPVQSQMKRYLDNVRAVVTAGGVDVSLIPAHMDDLTLEGANAIEAALQDVFNLHNG